MSRRGLALLLSLLVLAASAALGRADAILYISDQVAHSLYTVDPHTGSVALVGDFGIPNTMNALASILSAGQLASGVGAAWSGSGDPRDALLSK